MSSSGGKLALVVGGGPAPGINGVISAVTIQAVNHGIPVIGIRDGYKWLVQGSTEHVTPLTINDVSRLHVTGGSVLGTSRTNPAKNPEDMARVMDALRKLGVTMLVSIGGDDTAFSASQVYKCGKGTIKVAHVPKTIDNDLPLPGDTPTFGFETARQIGTLLARNLGEDAKTTGRWYVIVSMGRAAGHLALGIGKASVATLTVIPEEFRGRGIGLDELVDIILGSMLKRKAQGRTYGMVVLAEGLIETIGEPGFVAAFGEEKLSKYGDVIRDPHGHLRLGEIEFSRMVKDRLYAKMPEVGLKGTIVDKDLGYELRCADPIPFDVEYTRDLGYGAVKFLLSPESGQYGAVISFAAGQLQPLPFEHMLNPATGRMLPRKVNVDGESYECARKYMIRLEPEDFTNPQQLERLADVAGMTPEQFRARFGYVVGLKK